MSSNLGWSRRCNFSPWDKGQCPHGTLFHAVPGCCKSFQQCLIAPKFPKSRSPSYQTLLEALATPWDSVEQCSTEWSIGAVPCPKDKSCIVWTDLNIPLLLGQRNEHDDLAQENIAPNYNWRANIQSGLTHKSGVKTGRVA